MNIAQVLSDPEYPALKRYILEHTGLDYYLDKNEDLASRLARRVSALGMDGLHAYLSLLECQSGRTEMEALIGELTIGETYFFRQREHFNFLRDRIIPDLLERNSAKRSIRIWSAGCATGAEPYSVAMLFRLEMADRLEGWSVSILGTDINVEFLARAQQARYDPWAFRETPEHIKQRCFLPDGRRLILRPEFRERVSFQYHNLASLQPAPPGAPFDIILCRNVTIYFGPAVVRRVVANFYDALAEGGWLLVGHAEPNAETFARFTTISGDGTTAYQKSPPPPAIPWPQWMAPERAAVWQTPVYEAPAPGAPARPRPAPPPRPRPAEVAPIVTVDDARALADRGEWQPAASVCKQLIEADPLNAAAHFTMGLILEHLGRASEAEGTLRRAIYLRRDFALAHYHLGICLQQGNPTQARKAFHNVLRLVQGQPDTETIEHGDGITAADLRDLARMHLELLGNR